MPCPSISPNRFSWVQIILVRLKLDFYGLLFIIWTRPKLIGPIQIDWHLTKIIWTVKTHFGPLEGQKSILLIVKA